MMNTDKQNQLPVKKLWQSFEKTGSISAFLIYNEIRKKEEKAVEIKVKKQ